jgi:hypothetical protein
MRCMPGELDDGALERADERQREHPGRRAGSDNAGFASGADEAASRPLLQIHACMYVILSWHEFLYRRMTGG